MSGLEIAAAVAAIVSGCSSARSLFERWRTQQRKDDDYGKSFERDLADCARKVQSQYDESRRKYGASFAIGDGWYPPFSFSFNKLHPSARDKGMLVELRNQMTRERWGWLKTKIKMVGSLVLDGEEALRWFRAFEREIFTELEFYLFTQPRSTNAIPDYKPSGKIIFPNHTLRNEDKYALWMSGVRDIPRAFRSNPDSPTLEPEKEIILAIVPNPLHERNRSKSKNSVTAHYVRFGCLHIRGLENLLPGKSSSAPGRAQTSALMEKLKLALRAQVRLSLCYALRPSGVIDSGSASNFNNSYYSFPAAEVCLTSEGGVEWYKPKHPFRQAVAALSPLPTQSSSPDSLGIQDETSVDISLSRRNGKGKEPERASGPAAAPALPSGSATPSEGLAGSCATAT